MSDQQQFGYGEGPAAWGPLWPLVGPWMQVMQAWASAVTAGFPGAAAAGPWGALGARPAARVAVSVSSPMPVTVTPALMPGADAMPLTVDPLKAEWGPDTLPADAVRLAVKPGQVDVVITIRPGQTPGFYRGSVRHAGDRREVGQIQVSIAALPDATAPPSSVGRP